jgi:PAS domain S-box-containing protein/diguanylate cyclase (GGDEF)-like protein
MPLELNPEIYRAVLESVPTGVYMVDSQRRIVFWNASAERITGYLGQEVIGHFCPDNILMHCDPDEVLLCGSGCPMVRTMQDGRPTEANLFLRHKDGQRVPVRVRTVPIRDEFGAIIGSAEFFDRRPFLARTESDRRKAAGNSMDEATDLPDHAAMLASFQAALATLGESRKTFGVLFIAIDNVERLRHVDGWQAVHEVLYAVAQTLAASLRQADVVGRWEEERFLALIACSEPVYLLSCAERLKRLIRLAGVPWWGDRLTVTVSMGGTMAIAGDTTESILRRAGEALEASLAEGPDSVWVV